jgi:hypothetical protein
MRLRAGHGKAGEPMLAEQGYIASGGDPALGRIALVAVAVAVVGVFTVLQIRARSRRSGADPAASAARRPRGLGARRSILGARRPPGLGARRRPGLGARRRRARAGRDWRTLPPAYAASAAPDEQPLRDHDDYGPLWRYGSPRGYGRDYGPGHRPDYGPRYRPHDDTGRGAGRGPGYPAGPWPPRGTPAPYEEPRDWGS